MLAGKIPTLMPDNFCRFLPLKHDYPVISPDQSYSLRYYKQRFYLKTYDIFMIFFKKKALWWMLAYLLLKLF